MTVSLLVLSLACVVVTATTVEHVWDGDGAPPPTKIEKLPKAVADKGFVMGGNITKLHELMPSTKTMLREFITSEIKARGGRSRGRTSYSAGKTDKDGEEKEKTEWEKKNEEAIRKAIYGSGPGTIVSGHGQGYGAYGGNYGAGASGNGQQGVVTRFHPNGVQNGGQAGGQGGGQVGGQGGGQVGGQGGGQWGGQGGGQVGGQGQGRWGGQVGGQGQGQWGGQVGGQGQGQWGGQVGGQGQGQWGGQGGYGGQAGRQRFPRAPGVEYIGRGYNLIFGNPDIIELGAHERRPPSMATDPGMTLNFIFNLTWMDGDVDAGRTYSVPDQITYFVDQVCFEAASHRLITGMKSYQEKLSTGFDKNFGFQIMPLASRAFMGGQQSYVGKGRTRHKQKIYAEYRHVCTVAGANYRMSNEAEDFILNDDFKRAVCKLPPHYTPETKKIFTTFIDEFGTSVIVSVILGTMNIHRMELRTNNLLRNAMSGNLDNSMTSTGVLGVNTAVNFNLGDVTMDLTADNDMVKRSLKWMVGSRQMPRPTQLTIRDITDVFTTKFWYPHCTSTFDPVEVMCCHRIPDLHRAVSQALEEYGEIKGAPAITEDADVISVPLNWPRGYYTLPATEWGCPEVSENMDWKVGTRLQTTHRANVWSKDIHWGDGLFQGFIGQNFCTKDTDKSTSFDLPWPKGTYCIMRKGGKCPPGENGKDSDFKTGFIAWDDPNIGNENAYSGILPDGVFDHNTKIEYCCRNDKPTVSPIDLPNRRPFYLLMYGNECQRVRGMTVKKEWVHWDSWNLCHACSRSEQGGGARPRNDYTYENNKLYYCYYETIFGDEDSDELKR